MSIFHFTLTIDAGNVQILRNNGLNVVVAQQTGDQANVVWLSFPPAETCSVYFDDAYGLFASPSPIAPGSSVVIGSSLPQALPGQGYSVANGVFTATGPATLGVITVQNASFEPVAVGLTLNAVVNGNESGLQPLDATWLVGHQQAVLTPGRLEVWAGSEAAGTVIAGLPDVATMLPHLGSQSAPTLTFDSASRRFVPQG